ncbi:hypothetical protein ABIF50_000801 [Bradyrhizobium diazoefficiens]
MALRMAGLVRAKGGGFIARKSIPADVRDEYARLYKVRWEAQLRIPGGTPAHFAKTQHGEWLAEIETRIAALRAQKNGEGQPLTRLNAIALAGRWYVWFVKRAGPGCLDSAPLDLSGFLPGYAERGALRFCRCVGRA